jgi:hypothetical protein
MPRDVCGSTGGKLPAKHRSARFWFPGTNDLFQSGKKVHALKTSHGGTQLHFFIDIEEATRMQMHVSLMSRREQMVSDGVMLTYDQDHWNTSRPTEEPIQLPLDLTFDIELRKNAPDEDEGAA